MSAPLDAVGPAAPPRSNGELVFAEPWESRAFGMAVTLYEAGTFTWPQFQTALIARIAAWEAGATQGEPYNYYRLWLAALQDVLAGLSAVSTEEVTTRAQALARRPHGHGHRDHPDDPGPRALTGNALPRTALPDSSAPAFTSFPGE